MINLLKRLLNYIYKDKCYFCSNTKENTVFCSKCFESIDYLNYETIETILDSNVYSCTYYKGIIQKLIRAVKYHNKTQLAKFQAQIMFDYWENLQEKNEIYTLIAVPLHKNRQQKRRYNHMELIAKEFCNLTNYELNTKCLHRVKDTVPQYKLSKKQREKNLEDAFKVEKEQIPDSSILLIDDITTTGSTLYEIIKELRKYTDKKIVCLTTAIPEHNSFYIN